MELALQTELIERYRAEGGLEERFEGPTLEAVAVALADQFAALYEAVPVGARTELTGHVLTFGFQGGLSRFDELLLEAELEDQVREFRTAFLDVIGAQLAEVVAAISGVRVREVFARFESEQRLTKCLFLLDDGEPDEAEQRRALLNWSAQVRRNARQLRERHHAALEAHTRQRELVEKTRLEIVRQQRSRRPPG